MSGEKSTLYRFDEDRLQAMEKVCSVMLVLFARNLKGRAFRNRLDEESLAEIRAELRAPLEEGPVGGRKFRREVQDDGDGVESWMTRDRQFGVRLGALDHLEVVTSPQAGCERWEGLVEGARKVVGAFDKQFDFARDDRFGYYSVAPWMMGSGCHFVVCMQLGGLKAAGLLGAVQRAVYEWGFRLRPQVEEGAGAKAGGWFWLEPRVSMGLGVWRLFYGLLRAAEETAEAEMNARERLFTRNRPWMDDRVGRALGVLGGARQIGYAESLDLLTWLDLASQSGRYSLSASPAQFFTVLQKLEPGQVPMAEGTERGEKLAERQARLAVMRYYFHEWRKQA